MAQKEKTKAQVGERAKGLPKRGAESIRIFLADDHRIFLEGLVRLIQDQPSMKVIGTAPDGREALNRVRTLQPDVVLVDVSMPGLNGLEVTRLINKTTPKTRILVLSMHDNEEFMRRVLEAGAIGYLLKDATADELFFAIREAYRGNSYISPSLTGKLIADFLELKKKRQQETEESDLSGREREVLQLLAEGHTNQEIASTLDISARTVQTHRKQIMKKLNLHHLSDLVKYAIQKRIIDS